MAVKTSLNGKKTRDISKSVYQVEISFTTELLGSYAPSNEFFKLRRLNELEKEIKKLERALEKKRITEEERKAILEKYEQLLKERDSLYKELGQPEGEERHLTVFPRDENGNPILYNYQILGVLKETAKDFFKHIRGARNIITKYFSVQPRRINLYDENGTIIDEVDDILERPIRIFNPVIQQYMVSLTASEVIRPPARARFELIVWGEGTLHEFTEKEIRELLEIAGEQEGLLQWRNGGFGRFEVTLFEKVS